MSAYGMEKYKYLSELQLHATRSSLYPLPLNSQKRYDQKPSQTYASSRLAGSCKITWRGLNKPLAIGSVGPPSNAGTLGSAFGGALGSGGSGHSAYAYG
jgi:hypothetical protein